MNHDTQILIKCFYVSLLQEKKKIERSTFTVYTHDEIYHLVKKISIIKEKNRASWSYMYFHSSIDYLFNK